MIKVTHKPSRLIGAVLIFWLLNGAISNVNATTINFDYSGSSVITGSGSFSFTDGLSPVSLADLSSFSLTLIADYGDGDSIKPSFSFNLSNLTAFSATLDQNLLLTNLSLSTNTVFSIPQTNSFGAFFAPQSFHVTAIDTMGGAYTTSNGFDMTSTGTVTQSTSATVPEPSTLSLLSLIMLSFIFKRVKRNGLR